MSATQVKALLFDMGGVVLTVDFARVFKAWAEFSELDEFEIKSRFSMDEPYKQHEKGQIGATEYFEHLRTTLCLSGSDNELAACWNSIFESEYPECFEAIDSVRDRIPCYGFTNTNRAHQHYWEKHFPRVRQTFEKLFVSSEIGFRKPDAAAFRYVLDDISVEAEELLFFDDSEENTTGAAELGIQTVLVTDTASVQTALARFA